MIVGALGAIAQTNIKRMLAFSSIGHVGFALMGLASISQRDWWVYYLSISLLYNDDWNICLF